MEKGKVLSIDYGEKRIGLASGDLEHRIAFPRDIIENKGDALKRILDLCEKLDVKIIVIGLPLNMDEDCAENPVMKKVRKFVDELRSAVKGFGIQVELFDERLSSFEAKELTSGMVDRVDAHAAQIILQRYFDNFHG